MDQEQQVEESMLPSVLLDVMFLELIRLFFDVFPNTIIGVESVVTNGSSVTPGGASFTIDKINRIITIPKYGGATGDVRPVSGTITVTAIGY